MVNITVPIKQRDKFGFPRSEPQQLKKIPQQGLGDLEFIQKLNDEGRVRTASGSLNGAGTIASIVPASGETLYLIKASVDTATAGTKPRILSSTISGTITDFQTITLEDVISVDFNVVGISVVGNGVDLIRIRSAGAGTVSGNIIAYVLPTVTTSSRGSTT